MEIGELVPYIFLAILLIVAIIFITRAVFSIPAMLRYFKAIMQLLAINAIKQGAPEDQVKKILKDSEGPKE